MRSKFLIIEKCKTSIVRPFLNPYTNARNQKEMRIKNSRKDSVDVTSEDEWLWLSLHQWVQSTCANQQQHCPFPES